jgi:hypothetical protein
MDKDEEKAGDYELRAILVAKLEQLNDTLLNYPTTAPDEEFKRLQRLAIYFRDLIRRIDEKWQK